MDEERNWFVGVDWASATHHVCVLDAHGDKLGERGFYSRRRRACRDGGVDPRAHQDRRRSGLCRHRGATWAGGRKPDRARLRRPRHQPPSSSTASATASRRPAPRTTAATPRCLPMRSGPIRAACAAWHPSIPWSSSCANGRALPRISPRNAPASPIGCASSCGATIRRSSASPDDVAHPWFLELWALAPTPDKARRVRQATVAKLLKRRRIRRIDAAGVLDRLRAPPVVVAAGTTEAATAHIKAVAARARPGQPTASSGPCSPRPPHRTARRKRRRQAGAERRAARRDDPRILARSR